MHVVLFQGKNDYSVKYPNQCNIILFFISQNLDHMHAAWD